MEIYDENLILPYMHPNCLCLLVAKPVSESAPGTNMHNDFVRIRAAFIKIYGSEREGKEIQTMATAD